MIGTPANPDEVASAAPAPGALSDIRVLDASVGLVGPVATMLMADLGADVVRVPVFPPLEGDDPGAVVWRRNKRILAEADGATIDRLLAGCDVCVTSGSGEALAPFGLDPAQTRSRRPGLVHLHLPPDAAGPPWAGGGESNGLLAAWMGVGWRQVSARAVPVDNVYQNLLYMQAMWGAAAAVAALVERQRSGRGQTVTVDGVHAVLVAAVSALVIDPTAELDSSNVGPGGKNPWYTRYECSDGQWLFVGALIEKFQRAALRVLGLDGLPADERVAGGWDQFLSAANRGWLSENLAAALALRPRDEWLERLEAGGCPTGPLLRRDDWLDHPQIRALGMAVEVEDPAVGPTLMPGIPLQLSLTPGTVAAGRPVAADAIDWTPRPDPEGSVHLGAVQSGEVQSGGAHRRGDEARGPLAGIRIADLGTILAGPFTGSLLADLGADVVKVEPIEGDSFRAPGLQYNRGMRSLAIDLKAEEGCRLFTTLVESLDVVIDNYRPGVGERLGVDYASLVPVNPAIITLSISGFGDCGPLRHLPGFDPILQSMSGMMSAQGGAGVPCALSFAITDVAAATMSALGVCAALLHRGRTGEGQRIVNTLAGMSAFIQSGELVRFAGGPPLTWGARTSPGPARSTGTTPPPTSGSGFTPGRRTCPPCRTSAGCRPAPLPPGPTPWRGRWRPPSPAWPPTTSSPGSAPSGSPPWWPAVSSGCRTTPS